MTPWPAESLFLRNVEFRGIGTLGHINPHFTETNRSTRIKMRVLVFYKRRHSGEGAAN